MKKYIAVFSINDGFSYCGGTRYHFALDASSMEEAKKAAKALVEEGGRHKDNAERVYLYVPQQPSFNGNHFPILTLIANKCNVYEISDECEIDVSDVPIKQQSNATA